METYLRIDLVEIIEYASIQKTIHRGCTLTKWTRVNSPYRCTQHR